MHAARVLSLLVLLVGLALSNTAQAHSTSEPTTQLAPGETALGARLIAPCCWTQTLDVHESELATALRLEIRGRLLAGEAADAIEDDLAKRYGERIRAVPKGRDPRGTGAIAIGVGALLAALMLVRMVRGWTRSRPVEVASCRSAEEDARIDEELRALDR